MGLLALVAVQAEEEVVVQEVKPSGDETVGGHDKKVNSGVSVRFSASICFLFF